MRVLSPVIVLFFGLEAWEEYQHETVLEKVVQKALQQEEAPIFLTPFMY